MSDEIDELKPDETAEWEGFMGLELNGAEGCLCFTCSKLSER
jgi:hypothetical protein